MTPLPLVLLLLTFVAFRQATFPSPFMTLVEMRDLRLVRLLLEVGQSLALTTSSVDDHVEFASALPLRVPAVPYLSEQHDGRARMLP
jgi:hypothetical protein